MLNSLLSKIVRGAPATREDLIKELARRASNDAHSASVDGKRDGVHVSNVDVPAGMRGEAANRLLRDIAYGQAPDMLEAVSGGAWEVTAIRARPNDGTIEVEYDFDRLNQDFGRGMSM